MGTNALEKNMKKRKKMKRSHPEVVETENDTVESTLLGPDQTNEAATEANTGERKVKKVRKNKKKKCVSGDDEGELAYQEGGESKPDKGNVKKARKNKKKRRVSADEESQLVHQDGESELDKGVPKRARKKKRKAQSSVKEEKKSASTEEVEPYEIYQISSGEEDCSRGMKKWIKEYNENRPGLEVLQQNIDDFITTFEEQEEQAKKDREAKIAEEGWTVVAHRKGGKKTSDPDSGVAVGSVSQAAVLHKMDKKKSTEVGLDFYRFQRREAQRSEVMKLQSKFEEDKKRIQQIRAARKFKPY